MFMRNFYCPPLTVHVMLQNSYIEVNPILAVMMSSLSGLVHLQAKVGGTGCTSAASSTIANPAK